MQLMRLISADSPEPSKGKSDNMAIELSYMLMFMFLILFGILGITRKMSAGIAMASIAAGFGISYYLAPYMALVINPLGNSIAYGYSMGVVEWIGVAHLGSIVFMVLVAAYNLISSGGKIVWA